MKSIIERDILSFKMSLLKIRKLVSDNEFVKAIDLCEEMLEKTSSQIQEDKD